MFGQNPIRKPEKHDGTRLHVQELFATLQGEGPFSGWPAIFVRFGGCNLACDFCDTEFESFTEWDVVDMLAEIGRLSCKDSRRISNLVVITGGEPLRQEIAPLCNQLLDQGYLVQIETNGTLFRGLPYGVDIICSPKAVNGRYGPLRDDVLSRAVALKFIISKTKAGHDHVPDVGQSCYPQLPIYVQPMDEQDAVKNMENQTYTTQLCLRHGYRLSLQTHKIVGID